MLLDIGAKTSNLLFFEKGKVFSRSINIGANAITQDFANEAKLKFDEAEKIKIAEGFVSLGGAYEEPDNPHQAAISKIARQFMTKLHIQVNQTMQFYRGQQGGSAPQRMFLSGGASIMPYTAQFFAEKLNVPVEYFNPFRNVQIDPSVNLEELSRVAHGFGEVVGLGLRNLATCPVELNLMPESTLRWQSFNQKKPYFIATVISLVLVAFAVGYLFQKLAVNKESKIEELKPKVQELGRKSDGFKRAFTKLQRTQEETEKVVGILQQRYYTADFIAELRAAMIRSEVNIKRKLSVQNPAVDPGIWIEQMTFSSAAAVVEAPRRVQAMSPEMAGMPGGMPGGIPPEMGMGPGMGMQPPAPPAGRPRSRRGQTDNKDVTSMITLVFRAVNLSGTDPSANSSIAYAVENEIKASSMVDSKTTQLIGQITLDDATGTFTFTVNVTPLKSVNL